MSCDVLLRVSGLKRSFGGVIAVNNLDFDIRKGEILGLIGPNGAGKSTTFNVVSGFYRPTAGKVFFAGEDITRLGAAAISRRGLVRTFQHGSLMRELSVFDNIYVATITLFASEHARDCRVREMATMFNLVDVLADKAGNLPHGRQRMLSIAIAFARHPKLLCLDEPLTGLNQPEVMGVLEIFRRIRDDFGSAILLVEHNMRAVMEICDRIVVLNYGELLAVGRPEEISRNEQVMTAYLGKKT